MTKVIMYEPFQPTVAERLFGHNFAKFWSIVQEKAFEMGLSVYNYLRGDKLIVLTDCLDKTPYADPASIAQAIEEVVPFISYTEMEIILFIPEYLDHVEDRITDFCAREY